MRNEHENEKNVMRVYIYRLKLLYSNQTFNKIIIFQLFTSSVY
jgi:hypothetical protein